MFYRNRVKRLNLYGSAKRLPRISPDVVDALASAFHRFHHGDHLLPRLKDISCHIGAEVNWEMYRLLSRSSRCLRIDINNKQPTAASLAMISAIGTRSPLLETFSIDDNYAIQKHPDSLSALSSSIIGLRNLYVIDVPNFELSVDAIVHLSNLPHLHSAFLHAPSNLTWLHGTIIEHNRFPVLRVLSLHSPYCAAVINFCATFFESVSLEVFNVELAHTPHPEELRQLFGILLSDATRKSLTSILAQLHQDYRYNGSGDKINISPRDLEPLLGFISLKHLTIHFNYSLSELDDDFLEAMALSCPMLCTLDLVDYRARGCTPSKCTLRGYLNLARHCSSLTSLRLSFTGTEQINWDGIPGGGICGSKLRHLDVGSTVICRDSPMVASFLSAVFPNIIGIDAWEGHDTEDEDESENWAIWQETIRWYKHLVVVRREERTLTMARGLQTENTTDVG